MRQRAPPGNKPGEAMRPAGVVVVDHQDVHSAYKHSGGVHHYQEVHGVKYAPLFDAHV